MERDDGDPDVGGGAPRGGRRRRWWHRSAGVAVAVAVLVLGSSPTASGATPRKPSRAEIEVVAAEPADGPVHGEFPVVAADGSVRIQRWQWGEVVAVDQNRADGSAVLTVASSDGFAGVYRVAADQVTGITVGVEVTVVGVLEPD